MHCLQSMTLTQPREHLTPQLRDYYTLLAQLKLAFDNLDHNGDGHITEAELAGSFTAMGLSREEAAMRVRELRCFCLPLSTRHQFTLSQLVRWPLCLLSGC